MLKNINPLLGPELLFTLRSMGHGDEIAIVDGNYPANTDAKELIRADGHGANAMLDAILSVIPLDEMVEASVFMPDTPQDQPIHQKFRQTVQKHEPKSKFQLLKGAAFYDRVKGCFAIVATSETALYGNIVLRKGVIHL